MLTKCDECHGGGRVAAHEPYGTCAEPEWGPCGRCGGSGQVDDPVLDIALAFLKDADDVATTAPVDHYKLREMLNGINARLPAGYRLKTFDDPESPTGLGVKLVAR